MKDPWSEDTVFEFVIEHLDKAPTRQRGYDGVDGQQEVGPEGEGTGRESETHEVMEGPDDEDEDDSQKGR